MSADLIARLEAAIDERARVAHEELQRQVEEARATRAEQAPADFVVFCGTYNETISEQDAAAILDAGLPAALRERFAGWRRHFAAFRSLRESARRLSPAIPRDERHTAVGTKP